MYAGHRGLTAGTPRYGILILVFWLNYAECSLSCFDKGNVRPYNPTSQLCCNGIYPRVENGSDIGCCNGRRYPINSQSCCGGTIYTQDSSLLCCGNQLHDNAHLVCCNGTVYYPGKGICCEDKFFVRTGHNPQVCVNGVAVDKKSSQTRKLGTSIVNTTTNAPEDVQSEILYCGNVSYPKKSDKYRYECCDGTLNYFPHIHNNADYWMLCCGREIYNTSRGICCNGHLIDSEVQPIGCCNNKDNYTTTSHICCDSKVAEKRTNLCAKLTSSKNTLVEKDDVNHDMVCFDKSKRKFRTLNSKTDKCDNQDMEKIVEEIKKINKSKTLNAKPQTRILPPKCPSCFTGNISGPAECRRKNQLNVRITKIEKRKRDRLWLHVKLIDSGINTGRKMVLRTRRVCRKCFKRGVTYVIFTNRWLNSFPETLRLNGMDVIVQKNQLSSFNCTVDRWAKTL
ncbi:uncharacterized protein LOC127871909 isoform X1 [Dreissena polymorpha]|uniref:Galaxin-like repeats domain-containing protein n=1 Tax=Dreissena polymorpha TaxID=45954 RepID=A0A9D4LIX4_DREPO|nr:uncharacterized protein LOC127871909 isoform X1 [Dreissena polymorpha]KAH3859535.1 hypothetical protein DPMN_102352 [Dreissena polymorpha]